MQKITGLRSKIEQFNSVKTLMNTGDIVIINGSDNTSIKKIAVASGAVSVAALS